MNDFSAHPLKMFLAVFASEGEF